MAYNWQAGLGGAAGGAAAGAAFGPWGAVAGGALGLLGGFGGNQYKQGQMPTQINPYAGQTWDFLNSQYGNLTNQMRGQLGQAGQYNAQAAGLLNQFTNMSRTPQTYDPLAAEREFMSLTPQLQGLASRSINPVGDEATRQRQMRQIQSSVGDAFGGNVNSGAFAGAIGQATAGQLLAQEAQQQQLRAGLLSQLYGQTQSGLQSGFFNQAQFNAAQQQADDARRLAAIGGYQNLGQLGLQGASLYGGLAGQAMGGITGMGQQEFFTPDMYANPNAMSGGQLMGLGLMGLQALGGVGALGNWGGGGGQSQTQQYRQPIQPWSSTPSYPTWM